jgi:hypothetical protein
LQTNCNFISRKFLFPDNSWYCVTSHNRHNHREKFGNYNPNQLIIYVTFLS